MNVPKMFSAALVVTGIVGSAYVSHAGIVHAIHSRGAKGDMGLECKDCHLSSLATTIEDRYVLRPATCAKCHSPDGQYDGLYDPDIGVLATDDTGTYVNTAPGDTSYIYDENGNLLPGKEKWCLGCHDAGSSEVLGIAAPNIAGKAMTGTWKSPVAVVDTGFVGADNLIDNDLDTGNPDGGTDSLVFDLGSSADISHIRMYTDNSDNSEWEVYGSNDQVQWDRILYGQVVKYGAKPLWQIGMDNGWNESRIDVFNPVQYVKLVRIAPSTLVINNLVEFQYKADLDYGYLVTGHKITCDNCHDTQSIHVDGVSQTYKSALNNYSSGYRLADVMVDGQAVPAMEIPRVGINNREYPRTSNDFALCFSCHDKYNLLGDAYGTGGFNKIPLQTYFRNDNNVDELGNIENQHLNHLQGRGPSGSSLDWDSDWDGIPDSPQSCTACHNVHGSPNPAMTRHGELTSSMGTSDKVPMINFYYKNDNDMVDTSIVDAAGSTGGKTQFYKGGPGQPSKNNTCKMCHNDRVEFSRTP